MNINRRRDLIRLIREGKVETQAELAEALQRAGHHATQATVSRDLQTLGATKIRVNGRSVYRMPDEIPRSAGGDLMARDLLRNLDQFALDIRPAASLVVVTTAPGHASAVARSVDLAGLDEVVGSVAGDDTILVATPDAAIAERLARSWLVHSTSTKEEAG